MDSASYMFIAGVVSVCIFAVVAFPWPITCMVVGALSGVAGGGPLGFFVGGVFGWIVGHYMRKFFRA